MGSEGAALSQAMMASRTAISPCSLRILPIRLRAAGSSPRTAMPRSQRVPHCRAASSGVLSTEERVASSGERSAVAPATEALASEQLMVGS